MESLVLFILATIGMTHIIVDGAIFSPFRKVLQKILPMKMYAIFECYQCCGTWCGFICGAVLMGTNPLVIFMCGCAGSFVAVWGANYLNYLESKVALELS